MIYSQERQSWDRFRTKPLSWKLCHTVAALPWRIVQVLTLHASTFISKCSIRSLAARWLVRSTKAIFLLFGYLFNKCLLFLRHNPASLFLARCIFFPDFPNVAVAQMPFHLNSFCRFLIFSQKVAHTNAFFSQQEFVNSYIRSGQHIHSIKMVSTTYAISLQWSG